MDSADSHYRSKNDSAMPKAFSIFLIASAKTPLCNSVIKILSLSSTLILLQGTQRILINEVKTILPCRRHSLCTHGLCENTSM